MNRLWIGVGLLVILLAMGVTMLFVSRNFYEDFSQSLEQAGRFAMNGNWTAAENQAARSRQKWERYQRFWAAFTDHAPVEQMENLFSQLELYQFQQEAVDFSAVCRSLAYMARAIKESHGLKWWSVL